MTCCCGFTNGQCDCARALIYTDSTPVPVDHGGVEAGDVLAGLTANEILQLILNPYQYPAFTSFTISGQSNPLEVGDSIPAAVTFIWGTSNPANIVANSLAIRDVTNAIDLATGLANDGSEAIVMGGPIQKTTQASHVFRISGQNTKLQTFLRNVTYNWRWRLYYGTNTNATLDETAIEALASSLLTNTYARTYALGGGSNYKYVCFPTSFGTPTTFIDVDTGFGVDMVKQSPDVSVTNSFGQTTNYSVWRTLNIVGSTLNLQVS